MTNIGGLKQREVFAIESAYGTDPGSGYLTIGEIQGEPSVTADNKLISIHTAGRVNTRKILEGAVEVGASINFFVQDGAFLIASIGDFDTTSPVTNGSNYIHYGCTEDSTSTDASPVEYDAKAYTMYFGLEKGATDDVLRLQGCKTNSLDLDFSLNEPLKASATIFAKKIDYTTTAQDVTEITYGPWMFHNKGTLNINGNSTADVTALTIRLDNGLHRVYGTPVTDKRLVTDILQGPRNITGTVTLNYDTYTELSYFLSDTANATEPSDSGVKEMDIDLLLDNNETTTSADYRGIFFDIKELKLGTLEKRFPTDGSVVTETYNFTAEKLDIKYYDATATDPW